MKLLFPALAAILLVCASLSHAQSGTRTPAATPAPPKSAAAPVKDLLGRASDSALDKLAKPGSFSADTAIRIGLPGGKTVSEAVKLANQVGLGGSIETQLNDAATAAAGAAKPIFRAAVDKITLQDAAGMVRGSTGATDYLKKSASAEVRAQLQPLVQAALKKSGVLAQASRLSALGVNESTLVNHVTEKAADGIFLYMGREEAALRKNPLAALGR